MSKRKRSGRFSALLVFVVIVFLAILLHSIVSGFVAFLLIEFGMLNVFDGNRLETGDFLVLSAIISVPIGLLISIGFSKVTLKPVRDLISSMDQLAGGDFHARVKVDKNAFPTFSKACASFNQMAQELESTEMLRNDFIDNFSHEFKTPIVSIAGFAKLLRRGNLSQQDQLAYIRVIEEESLRLAYMATNVLNLTRVENQSILTDVTRFNLSEQIRSCILLLENKWEPKELSFNLQFGEQSICANEEMLKQVWINLLDNAIKFSEARGEITVGMECRDGSISVFVRNMGTPIPPEVRNRVFQKFYQADESHGEQGNGVGLAIVKRIVELHKGSVAVSCDGATTFTVELPLEA